MNFNNFCTNFYHIGNNKADIISIKYGLNKKKHTNIIKKINIKNSIEQFIVTNNEQKDVILKNLNFNKKKLIDNKSYHGYRLLRGLPLKNQRTKTNCRTVRRFKL